MTTTAAQSRSHAGAPRPPIDLLIGIDDTDNLETRGTGYRARCLGRALDDAGLATLRGITRHQLLVDPRIPYTSHNSSACLQVAVRADTDSIHSFCRDFMLEAAAAGSDVGLCVAGVREAAQVVEFGLSAKREVLDQAAARAAAAAADIRLEGLTGTRGGIIGALAGVGLYVQGDDGRYLWLERLRELEDCVMTVAELMAQTGLDDLIEFDGRSVAGSASARVALGAWARPVRVAGRSVLLVEKDAHGTVDFAVVDKARIKHFRP